MPDQTEQVEHTPTDWEVFEPESAHPGIETSDGFTIILYGVEAEDECGIRGRTPAEARANAKYIVKAANLFPELMEISKWAAQSTEIDRAVGDAARAILAKAEKP